MADPFDKLMIHTCDIQAKADYTSPDVDSYGQPPQDLTTVVTAWPCRFSTSKGGSESKQQNEAGMNRFTAYMRPPLKDDANAAFKLTNHHWLLFMGDLYNIIGVNDPSFLGHHLEVQVEQVQP